MYKHSFKISALCEIGKVKKVNQDGILVKVGEDVTGEFGLFLVADGIGGLAYGEEASEIIVNSFKEWWDKNLELFLSSRQFNEDAIEQELSEQVRKINNKVNSFGQCIDERIGATLSLLFIYNKRYIIKHIGDSRIYILGEQIQQLTEDHSWVAEQILEGKISKQQGKNHINRNVLTRCIGVNENIEMFESIGHIDKVDSFLICSDGFYNYLEEDEILSALNKLSTNAYRYDINEVLKVLYEKITQRGAADNISAILICQERKDMRGILKKIMNVFRKKIIGR